MIWKQPILLLSCMLCVFGYNVEVRRHRVEGLQKASKESEYHEGYVRYPSYEFSDKVNDRHTHDIKSPKVHADGDKVTRDYWIEQPDDRKRTVNHQARKHDGFHIKGKYDDNRELIKPVEEKQLEDVPKHDLKDNKYRETVEEYNSNRNIKTGKENNYDIRNKDQKHQEKLEYHSQNERNSGQKKLGRWIFDQHWVYQIDKTIYADPDHDHYPKRKNTNQEEKREHGVKGKFISEEEFEKHEYTKETKAGRDGVRFDHVGHRLDHVGMKGDRSSKKNKNDDIHDATKKRDRENHSNEEASWEKELSRRNHWRYQNNEKHQENKYDHSRRADYKEESHRDKSVEETDSEEKKYSPIQKVKRPSNIGRNSKGSIHISRSHPHEESRGEKQSSQRIHDDHWERHHHKYQHHEHNHESEPKKHCFHQRLHVL